MLLTWSLFILCAAVILVAGTQLSRYGDVIADMTGLGRTWIGVVLLASVELSHIVAVLGAMVMTAIAVVGLTYRSGSKRLFIAWDALGIVVVYALASAALYLMGSA
jgi:hypothetical protein